MQIVAGLEIEETGQGEAVLLSHGGHVADGFLPLMREGELAEHYRLIRYRRRGYGNSAPVTGAFNVLQQAQDANALLRHLCVDRAHLVGHSYGGAMAIQLAIEAPDLVHSITVLEPAILAPETVAAFSEALFPIFEAYKSGDIDKALDLFMSAASAREWRSAVQSTVPGGVKQAARDAQTSFECEIPGIVAGIFNADGAKRLSQPILFAKGSESGVLFDEAMKYFVSVIPHTEQVVIPGMNHLMQMLNPKCIAAKIAEFIARNPM